MKKEVVDSYKNFLKTKKDIPNMYKDLFLDFSPFKKDMMYFIYCYYYVGQSISEIKKILRCDYKVADLEEAINKLEVD